MIIKIVSQFLVAASVVHFLPADLAYLEHTLGEDVAYPERIAAEYIGSATLGLPEAQERVNYPVKVDEESFGIVTTAQSALVVDAESGMMLVAKHPDQVRSIGSVTKLMTAMVFLEQEPDLTQIVSLDPNVDLVEGGRIYLSFYTGTQLEDLLAASLVGSDNTATQSLIRFSGLSHAEFIDRMNEKALEIGMENTQFVDPTGIDGRNMSTARDLILLLAQSEEFPLIQQYSTTPRIDVYQSNGHVAAIENTNTLLNSYLNHGEYSIEGGKTGFLPQAGYVLATTVAENGKAVHVVVMGSETKESRVEEAKGLAAWSFKTFAWPGEQQ